MSTFTNFEGGDATFSTCRRYRYTLTRVWDEARPRIAWIGLNPSTADESRLDPTLRRVIRFSDDWGFGSFTMLNLFALRSTDPIVMKASVEPVGPENNHQICQHARAAAKVVAAWGTHGGWARRDEEVTELLKSIGCSSKVICLGRTKGGFPLHPLYVPSAQIPEPYTCRT